MCCVNQPTDWNRDLLFMIYSYNESFGDSLKVVVLVVSIMTPSGLLSNCLIHGCDCTKCNARQGGSDNFTIYSWTCENMFNHSSRHNGSKGMGFLVIERRKERNLSCIVLALIYLRFAK